jgi:shikimate dehydrogenase
VTPQAPNFLSILTGSFATPAAENPTVAMVEAAYRHHGLDARYVNCEVAPDMLGDAVRGARAMGWAGFNCSIPHKVAVVEHLDALGESAAVIGAVNCAVRRGRGYVGENTDGQGFVAALRTVADPAGKSLLVLGAGGAARAVVWALLREGAEVDVWNRTELRSRHLCEEIGGGPVAKPDQGGYGLIVNTTAVGLRREDPFAELPLASANFQQGQTVVDMVYGEEPTGLLAAAAEAGATTVDGIEILVRQGARSLEIWTGREPPLEAMRAAARR